MKSLRIIVGFIALFISVAAFAESGKWNIYLSYFGDAQDIESTDKKIYVQVNNGLYAYNRNDHSIYTYNKGNLLSDISVKYIAWAKSVKKLVVVYDNGNIDLLTNNGEESENISDLRDKSTSDDKTVNHLYIKDNLMLLSTGFGVLKIDLKKVEILETYRLGTSIQKAGFDGQNIYALSSDETSLFKGDRTKNLLDHSLWTKESWANQFDFHTINDDINADDKAVVETLRMEESPKSNLITSLLFNNGRLIAAAGGKKESYAVSSNYLKPALCEYSRTNGWKHYDEVKSAVDLALGNREFYQIAVNPADAKHVFAGTWGNGIYEFYDGKQVANHTKANTSVFKSAAEDNDNYVLAMAMCFSQQNQLFVFNGLSENALINYDCSTKKFSAFSPSEVMKYSGQEKSCSKINRMLLDSRGLIWFGNYDINYTAVFCLDPQTKKVTTYNNFVNQDGTTITSPVQVEDLAEDRDGNIWVATNQGPIILTPQLINNPQQGFYQVKVPRNDGTNLADYLMSGVETTCMAVDEAGCKWFGTFNNGVYCISADNMEQLHHFTVDDSSLLSNCVTAIAIDSETGEVFIGTDKGLCSYLSGVMKSNDEMTNDNVWAFPNPVTPDYNGEITICGLSYDSRITITTSAGGFVASGVSMGGTFKWDGCDKNGKRVASGVYMVHAATSSGESGVVCKVAVVR